MLHELNMLSVNQMCAMEVLMNAWKAHHFYISPLNDFNSAKSGREGLRSESRAKTDAKSRNASPNIANRLWNSLSNHFPYENIRF